MAKGKSNPVTTTEQGTVKERLPNWIDKQGRSAFANAASSIEKQIRKPGLTSANMKAGRTYVAPLTGDHKRAAREVRKRAFDADPYFASATEILDPKHFDRQINMSEFMTRNIDPETGKEVISFAPWNAETLSAFENPYTQNVINVSLAEMDRLAAQDRIRRGDEAAAADAFGGTGRYLQEVESDRNWVDKMAELEATLRDQGFNVAMGQFNTEREAAMKGLEKETSDRLAGSEAITDLGIKKQASGLAGADALKNVGDMFRDYDQAVRNAAAGVRSEPADLWGELLGYLNATPYEKSTYSTGQRTEPEAAPDTTGQIIGGAASLGGAVLSNPAMMTALLSDKRAKKDRKDVSGKADEVLTAFKSLPIETFRYKPEAVKEMGMPANQRLGPMAQQFAPRFGGDGQTIDVGNAIGALMMAVKALEKRTRAA